MSRLFKALLPLPIKGREIKGREKAPNLSNLSRSAQTARELYMPPVKEKT